MPSYTFFDTTSREEWTEIMSISEMEEFLAKNCHIQWVPKTGLPILDSVRLGVRKPDEGFRDILRQVKKKNPRSNVNTF